MPALDLGLLAVNVPIPAFDDGDLQPPAHHPHYRQVAHIGALPRLLGLEGWSASAP